MEAVAAVIVAFWPADPSNAAAEAAAAAAKRGVAAARGATSATATTKLGSNILTPYGKIKPWRLGDRLTRH